jgi:transposase
MAYNFLPCDRDQAFLLPPDVREWLPADHLAAFDPRTLLAVLLYGYCTGVRSSRQLERRCHEDIAFRVLAGNSTPTT